MSWETTSGVSSSSFALPLFEPSSSWSGMFVVCVGCWIFDALAGIVVLMWIVVGYWLPESAVYKVAFNEAPFQAILGRDAPNRVVREVVVFSDGSVWLEICGGSLPFLLG